MFRLFNSRNKYKVNVLILGNDGCGKNSFLHVYKDEVFPERGISPVKIFPVINVIGEQTFQINFVLDRASDEQKAFAKNRPSQFDIVLIMVDLSSINFNKDIEYWHRFSDIHFPSIKKMLVGTKNDIKLTENNSRDIITTSAKTGDGFPPFRSEFQTLLVAQGSKQACALNCFSNNPL